MNTTEIRRFYELIKDNNQLTEIRALDTKSKKTMSGYFTDVETLIKEVSLYGGYNLYFTLNSINEACASRSQADKMIPMPKASTSDTDIISRDWVLIDLDPKRPADTNASDEEKLSAQQVVNNIYAFLKRQGFFEPIIADSSNGYHLLYKVKMKNTQENTDTIKRFLHTIDTMFSTEEVSVDTSVYNASRICKLYGTESRKGTNTQSRPQRQSKFVRIPREIKITPIELFKRVNALLTEPEAPSHFNNYNATFDIDGFIRRNHILVDKEISTNSGRKILLQECPFDDSHKSPDSAIFVLSNGAIGFKCFHNSCSNHSWHDLRNKFEPKQLNQRTSEPIRNTIVKSQPIEKSPLIVKSEDKFLSFKDIKPIDRNKIVSIPSLFTELDRSIGGFNLGETSLWSGNNASGKSTVLGQIALNSIASGFPAAIYSGEMRPERVKNWLTLQIAGRQNTRKHHEKEYYFVPNEYLEQIDAWADKNILIYDNKYGNKILQLLEDLTQIVKKGVKTIILDNLMSIDILELMGDKYEKQSSTILMLTDFAKEHDIHLHIVAHPRKSNTFLRKTDVSGSADLTNAVENVFIVHRVNNEFRTYAADFLTTEYASSFFKYGNVIEVCKNRDLGVQDYLVGLYFEIESKRFVNYVGEPIPYNWEVVQQPLSFPVGSDFFDDLPPD